MNKQIASYFLCDSKDFLFRYKILKENSSHLGMRSKLLTELLFSLECAIKSLIFIESEEDEALTYKKVKKLGHNINKLSHSLNDTSFKKYNHLIKIDISIYEVYHRYQLESEIDFRNELGVLESKYYSTITNFQWLDKIYNQISSLIDYIESLNKYNLDVINFSDINIDNETQNHLKLVNLRKKNS